MPATDSGDSATNAPSFTIPIYSSLVT
jgi:hypothetical protein